MYNKMCSPTFYVIPLFIWKISYNKYQYIKKYKKIMNKNKISNIENGMKMQKPAYVLV